MAEEQVPEVSEPVKKPNFFDRLHTRVSYSAFGCPGYGQWHDGDKIRGGILMGLVFALVIVGFGFYAFGAIKYQECPMDLYELADLVPCVKWVSGQAWTFAEHRVWQSLGLLGIVYLVSLAEALWVRRHELLQQSPPPEGEGPGGGRTAGEEA